MAINFEKDYVPLRDAAEQMKIAYSTAHQYCTTGALDGVFLYRGTRWLVSKKTIELWNAGEISVKGAFRKRD
jgi:predicted site-specific integrase-resolvase